MKGYQATITDSWQTVAESKIRVRHPRNRLVTGTFDLSAEARLTFCHASIMLDVNPIFWM